MSHVNLKENTRLLDRTFPINVFLNYSDHNNVLYLHWHEHLEIIYMIKGEAIFTIGNQSYEALPGDVLFVNGGQLHSGYSRGNQEVEYYAIVFHPTLLSGFAMDLHQGQCITPYLSGEKLLPNYIDSSDGQHVQLQQWLESLLHEFMVRSFGFEIVIKSHLNLIISNVTRNLSQQEAAGSKFMRLTERFKPVFTLLETEYARKITVQEAAGIVNLSSYHFCKTFKKATGYTFVEFLNIARINEAERLLKKTDYPITEIAEKVGFCNINYFDKVYKKIKNYPPSAARK